MRKCMPLQFSLSKMETDFNLAIAASTSLLERAEVVLRDQWSANPSDWKLGWKLGETLRQMGRLDQALKIYVRVLNLNPQCEEAAHLVRILSGQTRGNLDGLELISAPFVLVDNLLPDEVLIDLWDFIVRNNEKFVTSLIGNDVDPHVRNSKVLYEEDLEPFKNAVLSRVRQILADSWGRLGMKGSDADEPEIQLTLHNDGGFYKAHRDNDLGPGGRSRSITYVIYLFRTPRRFSGGDLILYDWNLANEGYVSKFTRIIPRNNSLILFPSSVWHQVTPVKCYNSEFESGRFTINGWLNLGKSA